MQELTKHQTQEIGGGLDGVPYDVDSQRVIPPPLEIERGLGPVQYPEVTKELPSFGG